MKNPFSFTGVLIALCFCSAIGGMAYVFTFLLAFSESIDTRFIETHFNATALSLCMLMASIFVAIAMVEKRWKGGAFRRIWLSSVLGAPCALLFTDLFWSHKSPNLDGLSAVILGCLVGLYTIGPMAVGAHCFVKAAMHSSESVENAIAWFTNLFRKSVSSPSV